MPSAPAELAAKFPRDDEQAREILADNFIETAGVYRKKDRDYVPTVGEWEAIDYLFLEWDYGYEE